MVKSVKLVQIDGKLPNLALMRLSSYYKEKGYEVDFTRSVSKDLFDKEYDYVFGSSIFQFSLNRINRLKENYPNAIIGGTGTDNWKLVIEDYIGDHNKLDYSFYPDYEFSLGFTQRGCRLKCKFCVVPNKEGKNKSVNSIYDIWRGGNYPKKIHLLDNDFFGQPEEQWKLRIQEIQKGGFKVCFNQGINIRLIDEVVAENLVTIDYRDDSFKQKRIYTAWDNIGDEKRFFKGVDLLIKNGVKPNHIMAYMLIGYDKRETWERIWYRFNKMVDIGVLPYPMVYDPLQQKKDLKQFQRYVVRQYYRHKTWKEYLDYMSGNIVEVNDNQLSMFHI
tara:strand:- start:5590 stop:6585 length:996 start_codon:yes stop_codon:yes gene_type:complete